MNKETWIKTTLTIVSKSWFQFWKRPLGCQDGLFQAWLEPILLFPIIEKIMDIFQIQLPPEILPNLFHVNRIVNDKVHNLCNTQQKVVWIPISAIQESNQSSMFQKLLNSDVHSDDSVLATAVKCERKFATKVFNAIKAGDHSPASR